MCRAFSIACLALLASCSTPRQHPVPDDPRWLTYAGGEGPGQRRHIVLIAAEQEYRSEQSLPMLARILSQRHGFDCTVLFALDENGNVDPKVVDDVPGLEHLRTADLVIFSTRFLELPEPELRRVVEYLDSGKPIVAIRTANHGFRGPLPYDKNGQQVRFGEDVLGGTFLAHHGNWSADSTRGILVAEQLRHPILIGVHDIWGPSDVYRTYPEGGSLPKGCRALVYGQPLLGRERGDAPNPAKEPLPVAWTRLWRTRYGKEARVFHLTMGSAEDFECAGLRRLVINAAYWCMGLEECITPESSVEFVGPYEPLASGFDYAAIGVVPKPPSAYR